MPRNIFRGSAHAFAFDHLARAQTLALIETGEDSSLHAIERSFVYMPLEHAEDLTMQDLSVEKFTALADTAEEPHVELLRGYVSYAVKHREIVEKFGRFPHRNAILDRDSSPEESAFLAAGGPTFGQSTDAAG